ncbi:MAG: thioredoxin [Flavobacterium sp. BFFFF1]|uniref:thioredoxin n=1 Tax=unclassified Flavobacterium TaxID=196869 RepID=UPI000BC3CE94|nr:MULTISPECIES: thioredoxin [unclassified Flavobacterium]OYU79632.1 MAG: thioredoxin [Flavobacterium sp. BFFFF1]
MNDKFETIINSEIPVLVDFFATWCGPCQMLGPILKEVKDSLGDRVSIIKIDVDKNQEAAAHYRVKGVPTMMLFQNGKQLWRQSGVLSKEEIIRTILEKSTWPELPNKPR